MWIKGERVIEDFKTGYEEGTPPPCKGVPAGRGLVVVGIGVGSEP